MSVSKLGESSGNPAGPRRLPVALTRFLGTNPQTRSRNLFCYAMLAPVFGMAASALALGETLPLWKLAAGALVLCGLAVIVLWPRLRARLAG